MSYFFIYYLSSSIPNFSISFSSKKIYFANLSIYFSALSMITSTWVKVNDFIRTALLILPNISSKYTIFCSHFRISSLITFWIVFEIRKLSAEIIISSISWVVGKRRKIDSIDLVGLLSAGISGFIWGNVDWDWLLFYSKEEELLLVVYCFLVISSITFLASSSGTNFFTISSKPDPKVSNLKIKITDKFSRFFFRSSLNSLFFFRFDFFLHHRWFFS